MVRMQKNEDPTISRRGSSPPSGTETIYHEWLKRPRTGGTTSEELIPGEAAKKKPGESLNEEPLATNEAA